MDARLIAIINQLSDDLANLERAIADARGLLRENLPPPEDPVPAHMAYLAHQQPRLDGTFTQKRGR